MAVIRDRDIPALTYSELREISQKSTIAAEGRRAKTVHDFGVLVGGGISGVALFKENPDAFGVGFILLGWAIANGLRQGWESSREVIRLAAEMKKAKEREAILYPKGPPKYPYLPTRGIIALSF